jgi:beta-lactam-binding protein with PASTA domain
MFIRARVDPETAQAATAVLSGSGLMAAAPTSVIARPRPGEPSRPAPPGRTPPAGYYGYEGPPRRRRPVWPWVLSVLLLAAAAGAAWFAYAKIQDQLNANKPVPVPLVEGLDEPLAKNKIRDAGLVAQVSREFSDTVETGVVISQNPAAGEKRNKGGSVDIAVSKGKETVPVPSLIGKSRDDAVSTLTNAGLKASVITVHSSKPVDTVTRQLPLAGTTILKGATVQIRVSSGPADVTVPSVIGLPFDQASIALRNQGFVVSREDVESDQPADTVVNQTPSGSATPGSTITLSVSKGPKTSTVPDVTSQDEQSARDTLTSAGFKVRVKHQNVTDPGLEGIVLDQNPSGGMQADQGSPVTITVGRLTNAEPPPPVP